jgi:hypothetical protein
VGRSRLFLEEKVLQLIDEDALVASQAGGHRADAPHRAVPSLVLMMRRLLTSLHVSVIEGLASSQSPSNP